VNPVWHALWLAVETAAWFVVLAGAVGGVLYAMQHWLHVRLFR